MGNFRRSTEENLMTRQSN